MNVCKKWVTRAAVAGLGCALAVAGCSSNAPTGAPSTGSGQADGSDAGPGQAGSDASSGPSDNPGAAAEDAASGQATASDASGGCPSFPGVTVNDVDAGAQSPTWGCIESSCAAQLSTCAADCVCNDLILDAFFASHDLTSANAAFKAALSTGSPPADAILVGVCLQLHQSDCPMWGASGADGAAGD